MPIAESACTCLQVVPIICAVNADYPFAGCVQEGMMSLEVTDFLNGLDKIIEHDARTLGEQQMQMVVLRWAISFRDALSKEMRDSLITCMEQEIARIKAERPKARAAA